MDWKQSRITFSSGVYEMLGYNSEEFNMYAALSFIHPDDIKIVNRIIQGVISHSVNTSLLSNKQYLKITFRALKKDGTYIKVLRQSSPYQMDIDGKFISNLTFLTDISFIKSHSNRVEWTLFSEDMDVSKFKENIYREFIGFFTSRELEIVYLIHNNFTNKEIASQLFISAHTVVAHRKNILRKSNCHNSRELLEFCQLNGITYDDQFYSACGLATGGTTGTADCGAEPGTQFLNDTFESNGATLSNSNFELLAGVTLYPNPAREVIFISSDQIIEKIELYDIIGKQILTTKETLEVRVNYLQKGLYLLKLYSGNTSVTKKITIE
ncbi:LuxR C-terminal-related transcriptional regulator [Flaviramulus aquimarinus]